MSSTLFFIFYLIIFPIACVLFGKLNPSKKGNIAMYENIVMGIWWPLYAVLLSLIVLPYYVIEFFEGKLQERKEGKNETNLQT